MNIPTRIKKSLSAGLILLFACTFISSVAFAETSGESLCKGAGGTIVNGSCTKNADTITNTQPSVTETIKNVTNALLFIVGAIAVVMIIISGIRYATSNGDQAAITGAKNTILYAIVGVIVAFAAYAIVAFVTGAIKLG